MLPCYPKLNGRKSLKECKDVFCETERELTNLNYIDDFFDFLQNYNLKLSLVRIEP